MTYWDEHVVLNYNVNIIILFTIRSINPLTTITSLQKLPGSTHQSYSIKNVFLKISQNSQENPCVKFTFFTEHLRTTASCSRLQCFSK